VTPLVAQLSFEFPQEIGVRELDPSQLPDSGRQAEGLDVLGQATVDSLVQMAVTIRTEAMWKPLHHQVGLTPVINLNWSSLMHRDWLFVMNLQKWVAESLQRSTGICCEADCAPLAEID
jgi:hypothetical protein